MEEEKYSSEDKYTECYPRPLNGVTLPSSNTRFYIDLFIDKDGALSSVRFFKYGKVGELNLRTRSFSYILRKGFPYALHYDISEKLTAEQLDKYFIPPTSINRSEYVLKPEYKFFLNNKKELCIHRKKDHMQLSDTDHTGLYFDTPILAITPEEVTY